MTSDAAIELSADRPIADPAEDALGYAAFAKTLARGLLAAPSAEGTVVALYGPWGSGKSTVLNFVAHYLVEDAETSPVIVHFNPWWFASGDDLVLRFFATLRSELHRSKVVAKDVLKRLAKIAAIAGELAAVPGAGSAAKHLEQVLGTTDLEKQKASVVEGLRKQKRRILVVIDDLDRLTAGEVRDLFRVIKSVADFPNVVYLLAFDHDVVAHSLGAAANVDGAAYIEKIVQAPFHLPPPDPHLLHTLFTGRLDRIVAGTPEELFDLQHWASVFVEGIAPFLRTPRHVVRLTNALSVTYPAVKGEVCPVDFVALEALRIFVPDVYDILRRHESEFTGLGEPLSLHRNQLDIVRKFHDNWLDGRSDTDHLRKLLLRIFPELASVWRNTFFGHESRAEWRRARRICAPEIFPTYFRLAVPAAGFARSEMLAILDEAHDADAFSQRLLALTQRTRPDGKTRAASFLESVEDYTRADVPEDRIEPMIRGLLNAGDAIDLESDDRGGLDFGNDVRVIRVFLQLVRRLDIASRCSVILGALAEPTCLSTGLNVLRHVARDHGIYGTKPKDREEPALVPKTEAEQMGVVMLEKIRGVAVNGASLVEHRKLPYVLSWWQELAGVEEPRMWLRQMVEDDEALINVLDRFSRTTRKHPLGSYVSNTYRIIDPNDLDPWLSVSELVARAEKIAESPGVGDREQEILSRLLHGRAAREKGRDPRWETDEDEDELP